MITARVANDPWLFLEDASLPESADVVVSIKRMQDEGKRCRAVPAAPA